jgi:hypothetical protein
MFEVLRDLKEDIEYLDNYNLNYVKRCDELSVYANEFFKELINKYFSHLTLDILPIKFHEGIKTSEDYSNKTLTMGEVKYQLKQNIINIYSVMDENIDEVKQNIRHEIIHYCLNMSNYEFRDNTAIFHALCKRHDGHAYAEMPPDEEEKFDKWDESDQILEKIRLDNKNTLKDEDIHNIQYCQEQSILGIGINDNIFNEFKNAFESLAAFSTYSSSSSNISSLICRILSSDSSFFFIELVRRSL